MFQALFNSLSGLFSYSKALDTVSNNVANMNTPGFRGSDTFFENIGGEFGTRVAGQGVRTSQGLFSNTGNSTDLAINGTGYFVLQDPSGNLYYTRAGQFKFNEQGVLIDTANQYDVMSIDASGNLSTIDKTPYLTLPGQPTTAVKMTGSLFEGTPATFGNQQTQYQPAPDYTAPNVQIFDSVGVPHNLTVTFRDTSSGTPGVDSTFEVTVSDGTKVVGSGPISFDAFSGHVSSGSNSIIVANPSYLGVGQTVKLNFGAMTATPQIPDGINQSSVTGTAADGRGPLALGSSYAFDVNGVLQLNYSTTESKQGPQIALASFTSDDALHMIGGRLIAASSVQHPVFGHAGSGVFGSITGGSLEQSNVDLTQEFAQMIIIQRGYQASSKVMTVSNQMIEQLYNGQSGG